MTGLRDKYAIVGVGETAYSRASGRSTRSLAVEAIRNAMIDAGLGASDIDGMISYQVGDSTPSGVIASDLGIRNDFFTDSWGGGSSTERLIGIATGVIEAGMCTTVAVFRSMNGYSSHRFGGSPAAGATAPTVVQDEGLFIEPYGVVSAAQMFQFTFARHMYEYGTTSEQLAHVRVVASRHASNNPKAYYRKRLTAEDVLESRWIVKPACRLLDCCVETDNATCLIVTSAERARDLRQRPILIKGVVGHVTKPFCGRMHAYNQCDPITRQAGYYGAKILFPNAGVEPADIQLTGCYDCFTFTPVLLLESYGFCAPGEGAEYVTSGAIQLGGARPNNTSGGQLTEGYTHGMNLVIENVRQLRHAVDDSCPPGRHTYDYSEGGCRQVRDVELAMNMGWANPALGSAVILGR